MKFAENFAVKLTQKFGWSRPWLAPLAGVLLVLGEKALSGWSGAGVLSVLGTLLLLAMLLWNLIDLAGPSRSGAGEAGKIASATVWLPSGLLLLGAVLYFLGNGLEAGSKGAVDGFLDWAGLLRWGWIFCAIQGTVLLFFIELSHNRSQPESGPSPQASRRAMVAGNGFGLLVLLVITLNFNFNRLPWEWNLAYFKVTHPSAATREVASGLEEPVQALAFFAADSAVAPLVRSYFEALSAASPPKNFSFRVEDAHLKPGLAHDFKARGNGWIVFKKGALTSNVFVGEEFPRAREQLIKLDESIFERLQKIGRKRLTVYFTVGHGERNETGQQNLDRMRRISAFQGLLRSRNFLVKTMGVREGLVGGIPDDAAIVVIAGPEQPFRPEEAESLRAYLDRGGKLMMFFEPPRKAAGPGEENPAKGAQADPLRKLLSDYGIGFDPVWRANDRFHGRHTFTIADRSLLVTVRYQRHPSVNQMLGAPNQNPLLFLDAGALIRGQPKSGYVVQETVLSMPGTWADRNRDFIFNPGQEKRGLPPLVLAVGSKPKGNRRPNEGGKKHPPPPDTRILAFADVDLASDLLMQSRPNRVVLAEAMSWLADLPPAASYPNSEKDIRILHAKVDDWLWFYLPVVGIPLLVLLFGFLRVSAGRRGRRPDRPKATPQAPPEPGTGKEHP